MRRRLAPTTHHSTPASILLYPHRGGVWNQLPTATIRRRSWRGRRRVMTACASRCPASRPRFGVWARDGGFGPVPPFSLPVRPSAGRLFSYPNAVANGVRYIYGYRLYTSTATTMRHRPQRTARSRGKRFDSAGATGAQSAPHSVNRSVSDRAVGCLPKIPARLGGSRRSGIRFQDGVNHRQGR